MSEMHSLFYIHVQIHDTRIAVIVEQALCGWNVLKYRHVINGDILIVFSRSTLRTCERPYIRLHILDVIVPTRYVQTLYSYYVW